MYRALKRLHQYVETSIETQELNLPNIKELTWEYLCNPDLCFKKQELNLLKLCTIQLDIKSQVTCGHCRFRKTFFIFKALARKKIVSKETRAKQISEMLQLNSEAIVKFCFKKIEDKWGENCVSESQIQMLNVGNNEPEGLENTHIRAEVSSRGEVELSEAPMQWPNVQCVQNFRFFGRKLF